MSSVHNPWIHQLGDALVSSVTLRVDLSYTNQDESFLSFSVVLLSLQLVLQMSALSLLHMTVMAMSHATSPSQIMLVMRSQGPEDSSAFVVSDRSKYIPCIMP